MQTTKSNIGNLITIKKHGRGKTRFYEVRYAPDPIVQPIYTRYYRGALATRAENIRRIEWYFNRGLAINLTELDY
jgi:hypothetical protein